MNRLFTMLPRLSTLSRPSTTIPSLLRPVSTPSTPSPSTSLLSSLRSFSSSPIPSLSRKPTKTKLKTHKGAAKRWLSIANGQFKRSKSGRVHLNGVLSPTRLNRLGQAAYASPQQKKLLRRLLPYA